LWKDGSGLDEKEWTYEEFVGGPGYTVLDRSYEVSEEEIGDAKEEENEVGGSDKETNAKKKETGQ